MRRIAGVFIALGLSVAVAPPRVYARQTSAAAALPAVTDVVERAQPSVVSIAGPGGAIGSGFVVRADGLVATNAHVVDAAAALTVTLADGTRLAARVAARHPVQDLALLRVSAGRALPALALRDGDPRVGEWVIALGNPFGLGPTATIGIIGATGRALGRTGPQAALVQTDAAINPGNSGGPLCDVQGRAVAVASAAVTVGQGIGFAIPIALVREMVAQAPAAK
ncbi:MAG: trypsin-like peptidase domain-containing protein [Vicinamibacterales bacterium]